MSSRMTMAVSVSRSIHEWCVTSWKRQHVSCSMCNDTLWQRDTISLPLLHCVWFRDERARSIYICAKCFRHKKPKKKDKRDIDVTVYMCARDGADGITHNTEEESIWRFFMWRVPFTVFVRCPALNCFSWVRALMMWWWKTQFRERKKKFFVGLTVTSLPSHPDVWLSPCISVKLIY